MANKKYSSTLRHGHVWLGKRSDSGIWYIKYQNPRKATPSNPHPYQERSLGTTIRNDAIKRADQINIQILNREMGVADGTIPIRKLFESFETAKVHHLRPEGMKRLRSSKNVFLRWLDKYHPEVTKAKDVDMHLVRDFQSYRLGEGKAKRTIDNDITNLHSVFRWAKIEKLVPESPFDYSRHSNVSLFKEPCTPKEVYSKAEYDALVAAAEAKGDLLIRDLIILLANTGMRFGEAARLVPTSLLWERTPPVIEIRAHNDWAPKDKHEIKTPPMTDQVQEILRKRESEANGEFLFQNSVGNQVAANKTRERLQSLFPEVGIDPARRLHWHSWRNYFILKCVNAHVSPAAIMGWVGHDCIDMVMEYINVRENAGAFAAEFQKIA